MRKKIELDRLEKMLHLEKAQAPVQFFCKAAGVKRLGGG